MKIVPVGTKLFHEEGQADGWTDMTNVIFSFQKFYERA